ncbi:unnamed protein product [Brachionus calyciflorus]|uniref:Uncharacterized protein n=1 Tax=Brachionus calyciflorus TaxID=104777 RepID=A0A813U4A5_9BILA|nr:unnamed protein product [Brachionus calyciflorus]
MFNTKSEIIGYFSDQINLIDLQCEKILMALESYEKKDEEKNLVNTTRKILISKVKEIEFINMKILENNFQDQSDKKFCFFIPKEFSRKNQFEFSQDVGKLVVLNEYLSNILIEKIIMIGVKKDWVDDENIENFEDFAKIPQEIFRFMSNLNRLTIFCDKLSFLRENNFQHLENLTRLEIRNSEIEFIETNTFSGLKCLNTLQMTNNKIKNFGKGAFNHLENLKHLDLNENCIEILKKNTFDLLSNLEYLKITDNPLSLIESDAFNGLNHMSILEINSTHKQLNFDSTVFHTCVNLKVLNLGENSVNLTPEFFDKLTSLQFLNIRHNMINEINFLNKMENLEFLDVQFINSKEFGENFEKLCLSNLKFLVITCETVPRFSSNFSNLQGIEIIGPKSLPNDVFANLVNLDYFKLRTNDQKLVDKSEKESFNGLKNLKYFAFEINDTPINLKIQLEEKKSVFMSLFDPLIQLKPVLVYLRRQQTSYIEFIDEEIYSERNYFHCFLKISDKILDFIDRMASFYYDGYFVNSTLRSDNLEE